MKEEYLLSICIPTYNRASVLEKTLESFIKQLDDDIEIVISDNCSSDNTEAVVRKYAEKFENVKYYRNEVNVRDANFSLSLDRGKGLYLKLMKDNLEMTEGSLHYMKQHINQYKDSRKPLFFTNGKFLNGRCKDVYVCNSFNDFIFHTSYLVTGITFFGCWREQWEQVRDRDKYSKLQLSQDDWVYQLLAIKGSAVLCTKKFFYMFDIGKRSGYNWFEVHVTNYYKILQPYIDNNLIDADILKKEKSTYISSLKPQLAYAYLYKSPRWGFDLKGKDLILWNHFKKIPKYYLIMMTLPISGAWILLKFKLRDYLIKRNVWDVIKKNSIIRRFS